MKIFRRFLTSGDLVWPWHQLLWKADAKSFILIYDLQTSRQFWNLTQNVPELVIWPQTQKKWKPEYIPSKPQREEIENTSTG